MSVFNSEETPASYLEALVGEGKKFNNPEELARGKFEADQYIEQLKSKLAELETDAALEDRLKGLLTQKPQTPAPDNNGAEAHQPAKPATQDIDLAAEVKKILAETSIESKRANNVNEVASKLIETFGDETKANQAVKQKAADLGVSIEYLQDVAAQSPKAFFSLVGVEVQTPNRPTQGDVNTAALKASPATGAKPNTYSWYKQLRKDNPTLYRSAAIQEQMHKDALSAGADFYK